jgi:tetratricopeptide (TPR) repeat protein
MVEDITAARELYRAVPPLEELPIPAWFRLIIYRQYAEIAAALGDVATAESAYQRLLPHASLHCTVGAGVTVTLGSIQGCLGLAAAACGHTDTAIDHFRTAVTANTDSGLAPFAADARHRLAALLHQRGRPGDRAEALTNATAANTAATMLGIPRLQVHTTTLLGAMNGTDTVG